MAATALRRLPLFASNRCHEDIATVPQQCRREKLVDGLFTTETEQASRPSTPRRINNDPRDQAWNIHIRSGIGTEAISNQ